MTAHENLMGFKRAKIASDRSFCIVFALLFLTVAFFPLLKGDSLRVWSLYVASSFAIVALVRPQLCSHLNRIWMKLGTLLSKVTNLIIMGIIYFTLIFFMGLIIKILKKDILKLKYDSKSQTYWTKREKTSFDFTNQF